VIVSNRGVRNAEGDFAKKLRNCLVYGIRFDAELYVCRRTIDAVPAYADVIGRCCRKMKKYGEFLNKNGTKLLTVLHNTGKKTATINGKNLPGGHLSFDVTTAK